MDDAFRALADALHLEPVQWLLVIWLLVPWVRLRDDRLLLALGVVTGLARPNRKKLRTNCGFGTVPVSEMFTADLHLTAIDQRCVRDRRRTPVIAFEIPSHQRIQGDAAEG